MTNEERKSYLFSNAAVQISRAPTPSISEGKWPAVLQTLNIQPSPDSFHGSVCDSLAKRYHETQILKEKNKLNVHFMGFATLFPGVRIHEGKNSDWAMMNLNTDPGYTPYSKFYFPATVRADIKKIENCGLCFDAVYIAHEVPKGVGKLDDKELAKLIAPPEPPIVKEKREAIETSVDGWWNGIKGTDSKITSRWTAHMDTILEDNDPVLFGIQFDKAWKDNNQPIGLWYYLTHWYW